MVLRGDLGVQDWSYAAPEADLQGEEVGAGHCHPLCLSFSTLAQMSPRRFITFNPFFTMLGTCRHLLGRALMQTRVCFYGFN